MSDPNDLLVLFQRPKEPMSIHKIVDEKSIGVVLPPEYVDTEPGFSKRFQPDPDKSIVVQKLDELPNLDFANKVTRDGAFSLFLESHVSVAGQLIELLMQPTTIAELMSLAVYVRDRVNPYLFQYAFSVVMQHRPDTKNVDQPSFLSTLPEQFVDPKVMPELRLRAATFEADENLPLEIPREFTASDREDEHLLAYFREDIGVNLHHWHWHLVYPTRGGAQVVNKDRRGELFYYMHTQLISRYNVARICNGLARVVPLNNLRAPVPEAYFPKIIRGSNNRAYPPRVKDSYFKDLDRIDSDTKLEISDLERWRDRILEAIDRGYAENTLGERVPLDEFKGIDLLGNMVEPSDLSLNREFYGQLHNAGHDLISFVHDPDYKHLEDYGVMGDVATAVRDPIFYRWHSFIDSIFQKHKEKLPSYSTNQLGFNGVALTGVTVQMTSRNAPANNLVTVWTKSTVDLQAGMDFNDAGSVYAQFTHLNHAPFEYQITVNNTSGEVKRGTCRIFLGPKRDERGNELTLRNQRLLMIEMDKWSVVLSPGQNTITRQSCESNVTVPDGRTFRSVGKQEASLEAQYRFCSCGWPHHMLVPKGTATGMDFDVFVMISNGADDIVNQNIEGECNDSHVFCGIRDKLYPDKRSMGFPFDRTFDRTTDMSLQSLAALYGNMRTVDVRIRHVDKVVGKFTC